MLEWIDDYGNGLNVIANFLMLGVWLVYLQLFLVTYRRQRQPGIIINRGPGKGVNARCLVSNLSAKPIYIQSMISTVRRGEESWTAAVTDLDPDEIDDEQRSMADATSQGPLEAGAFFDAGRFGDIVRRNAEISGAPNDVGTGDFDELEIVIVAAFGSEALPVGARRTFRATGDHGLRPASASTHQISGSRERKQIKRLLEANL